MGDDKSVDLFGIKPYGETLKVVAEKSMEGIGAFLSAV